MPDGRRSKLALPSRELLDNNHDVVNGDPEEIVLKGDIVKYGEYFMRSKKSNHQNALYVLNRGN
jgi:hypothetical protein